MNTPISYSRILKLIPLREHATILANLLELYAHDFSEFHSLAIGADGKFGYKSLPLYCSEPNRRPFFVRVDGKLAGLALVKRGSEITGNPTVWDTAEFFILRGCRRRGIGTLAAWEVWRRFPGPWEIRVMQSNLLANLFWGRPTPHFTGVTIQPVCVERDGQNWQLFSFESMRVK